MSELELRNVNKHFGGFHAIKDVDLSIRDGELIVFVGPSGCGKSTMLRMIAGLETVTSGELVINGEVANDWTPVKREVAMVFQSYALYPNMTVAQNIAFGLQQSKMPKAEITERVREASNMLKLGELMNRRPSQLSGGQSQRVAIGRSIVRHPGIFLFDEPLSNLDAELRVHMRVELVALHQRLQKTMIYVTHDQVEAMTMADRIVVFSNGKIEQVGTPLELYNAPKNEFVAGFLGSPRMNFLEEIDRDGSDIRVASGKLTVPDEIAAKSKLLKVGLRPEHIELGAPDDLAMTAKVTLVEQLGGENFVYGETAHEQTIVIKQQGQIAPRIGDTIGFGPRDKFEYYFDANSECCLNSIQAGESAA